KKIKGLISFFFGKSKKPKKAKQVKGHQTSLEELDMRKLIRLYCKYENLYNPMHPYYGNAQFIEDCYNDMARSIPGRTSFELRSCIEDLRQQFEQEYWIIESARQSKGEVLMPSIRYYNEFLFLVPFLCMDLNKSHAAENGTSSLNPKCVTKPDLLANGLNHFTGFPLSAFPGKLCCSPKELLRRISKKDGNKQTINNKQTSEVNLSPSEEQRLNEIAADNQVSKVSIASSHYPDEQDIKTTDLTCSYRSEKSPCVSECRLPISTCPAQTATRSKPQKTMNPGDESNTCKRNPADPTPPESPEKKVNGPDSKPCPCSRPPEKGKEAAPEDKRDNPLVTKYQNFKQVQMLCDMIRTELTAAPDFIYFDAKWRIIEILREVHKRQLVHMKAGPQKTAMKEQFNQLMMQHHPYKPDKNSPVPMAKPGLSRIFTDQQSLDMDALFSSSKLIKHWPSCLIGLVLLGILKYVLSRRKGSTQKYTLDNEMLVEDFEDTDELQPALEEKPHVPFVPGQNLNPNGAKIFYNLLRGRRSIRSFSSQQKPDLSIIEDCIWAAGTAPSGAHTEPWTFCVVESQELKQSIREIVEQEELINYSQRMHPQWVTDLRPLQTNHVKEYLTDAPYLILIFKQTYGLMDDGRRKRHYYNEISTSIAAGILLCALQAAGLSSLVTTPLNCGPALRSLLNRPVNEKLLILLPVGYAAEGCQVPDLERKHLSEILVKF
ncbi:hypothetical protein KR059_006290, partial [Drosophila kikkawai]